MSIIIEITIIEIFHNTFLLSLHYEETMVHTYIIKHIYSPEFF